MLVIPRLAAYLRQYIRTHGDRLPARSGVILAVARNRKSYAFAGRVLAAYVGLFIVNATHNDIRKLESSEQADEIKPCR